MEETERTVEPEKPGCRQNTARRLHSSCYVSKEESETAETVTGLGLKARSIDGTQKAVS